MLLWRDRYYWQAKERGKSGDDKCEFAELLKQEWEEFERQDEVEHGAQRLEQNRVFSLTRYNFLIQRLALTFLDGRLVAAFDRLWRQASDGGPVQVLTRPDTRLESREKEGRE